MLRRATSGPLCRALQRDLIHKRPCLVTVVQVPVLTAHQCWGEQPSSGCAELAGDDMHLPVIANTCPPTSSLQFSLYGSSHAVKLKGVGGNTPSVIAVEGISGKSEVIVFVLLTDLPEEFGLSCVTYFKGQRSNLWMFSVEPHLLWQRSNFTGTSPTWISFTLRSKQIPCIQMLDVSSHLIWCS